MILLSLAPLQSFTPSRLNLGWLVTQDRRELFGVASHLQHFLRRGFQDLIHSGGIKNSFRHSLPPIFFRFSTTIQPTCHLLLTGDPLLSIIVAATVPVIQVLRVKTGRISRIQRRRGRGIRITYPLLQRRLVERRQVQPRHDEPEGGRPRPQHQQQQYPTNLKPKPRIDLEKQRHPLIHRR